MLQFWTPHSKQLLSLKKKLQKATQPDDTLQHISLYAKLRPWNKDEVASFFIYFNLFLEHLINPTSDTLEPAVIKTHTYFQTSQRPAGLTLAKWNHLLWDPACETAGTYQRPFPVRVDGFNVKEKWLHFTPWVHGEGALNRQTCKSWAVVHSVTPTVRHGGEFEHSVQGAPQVRQLICERRWTKTGQTQTGCALGAARWREIKFSCWISVPAGLSRK